MPCDYKRKPQSRRYNDYEDNAVIKAMDAVNNGMSIKGAARLFEIAYGTLHNRLNIKHEKNIGAKLRIPIEVESEIVLLVDYLTELKVPLDGFDIRCIVKTLLDSVRITDKVFNDNMPGVDWEYGFIKRHNLTNANC